MEREYGAAYSPLSAPTAPPLQTLPRHTLLRLATLQGSPASYETRAPPSSSDRLIITLRINRILHIIKLAKILIPVTYRVISLHLCAE
jgi:hypothetical protein